MDVSSRIQVFKERYPDRCYNVGIAEQSLMSTAAGLAHEGFKPLCFAFPVVMINTSGVPGGVIGHKTDAVSFDGAADDNGSGMHSCNLANPYVDVSTGSLGHGLPVAGGIAAALRRKGSDSRVYCVVGDGECGEGSIPPLPVGILHVITHGVLPDSGHHIAYGQIAADVDQGLMAQIQ